MIYSSINYVLEPQISLAPQQQSMQQQQAAAAQQRTDEAVAKEAAIAAEQDAVAVATQAANLSDVSAEQHSISVAKKDVAADTARVESPHDESDYEDNITVTVPPAHLQSGDAFRDRHLNNGGGGYSHRHLMPPGMDTPPTAISSHAKRLQVGY